jgi:sensor histidine kinase YesM
VTRLKGSDRTTNSSNRSPEAATVRAKMGQAHHMNANIVLSVRTKILVLCISCTLVALVLQTMFFQYSASAIVYRQEQEASQKSLENMQDELYTWIKSYENNLIKIYNQTELIRDLSVPLPLDELRRRYDRIAYDMALTVFDPAQNVNALYLYTMDNGLVSYYRSANTPRYNYPEDIYQDPAHDNTDVVTSYVRSESRVMLISSYLNGSRTKDIVRFVLKIYTNNVAKKIGFIVCDVDSGSFARIMEKYMYSDRQLVWLQPMGDRPAVSFGSRDGRDKYFYESIASKKSIATWAPRDASKIGDLVLFQVPQRKYNLTAYSLTPQYLLEESQWVLRRNMLVIALIVVTVAIVSATLLTRSLTTPLSRMVKSLQRIKNGATDVRVTGLKRDEIGSLGQTINEMLDRIQALIAEEYKVTLLLKQAEYKALQAQVNPHFLYNSLETMSSVAASQQCHTVSTLCHALSHIFRYSIDMKDPLSTIQDEIIHIKNYMYIINVRTQNSVELEIRIENELLHERVPRLSLQPLVENSFTHGLTNKRGAKKIVIDGSIQDGSIVLSVSDNGVGMDADEINRQLQIEPAETLDKSSSVGLGNIHARTRLLFGDKYGVTVRSTLGKGSTVTLAVPRTSEGSVPS